MSDRMNADYQRNVSDFVGREVIYCVSSLVYELAQQADNMDDLLPVCAKDDWEEPAYYHARQMMTRAELAEHCESALGMAVYDDETHEELAQAVSTGQDEAREFCDHFGLDPDSVEAYEHWIVSNWLADKLKARGEMILRDFMGLTIWGRTCTGQAISLDSVICDIYDDLHRKAA